MLNSGLNGTVWINMIEKKGEGKWFYSNRGNCRRFDYTFDSMAAFIAVDRIKAQMIFRLRFRLVKIRRILES